MDQQAFMALYDQHRRMFAGYAARLAGNDLADDVLQEAVATAWLGIRSYDVAQPFAPWMCTIIYHTALNFRRSESRRKGLALSYWQNNPAEWPSGSINYADEPHFKALRDCLQVLPDEDQKILAWKYVDDKEYKVIAKLLDRSLATVSKRFKGIREDLRLCISTRLKRGNTHDR